MNGRSTIQRFLFCSLLLGIGAAPSTAQTRRALLIGIEDYLADAAGPAFPAVSEATTRRTSWSNLGGPVNDVAAIREILIERYKFQPAEIKVLTNQAASRAAILEAIRTYLIAPAQKEDETLFFYAGHGSQVVNSKTDEPDGKDETIVPADSRLGARDIRDKELRGLFNQILDRGARLTVILDSCHSGSGARGLPSWSQARRLPLDPRDVADASEGGPRPEDRGALVLSASQDDQSAFETLDEDDQTRGAFSLALLDGMRQSPDGEPAERIFLRAKARLQAALARQEPVLSGPAGRPFFSGLQSRSPTAASPGRTALAVRKVQPDGTVLLQGGWAHGLRVGSELELPASNGKGPRVRLRVKEMKGLGDCIAEVVGTGRAGASRSLASGDLFEITGWSVPPQKPLKAWVPDAGQGWETVMEQARGLRDLARKAGVAWVADPVLETPSHVLSWLENGWALVSHESPPEALGRDPDLAALIRKLASAGPVPARLFVQLPAPPDLMREVQQGLGTEVDTVEATAGPKETSYSLVGRLQGDAVEYAWVRPATGEEDKNLTSLPARTDWIPLHKGSDPAALPRILQDKILRISKIQSWLELISKSPPDDPYPYHLALREEAGKLRTSGVLEAGERYGLVLQVRPGGSVPEVQQRYAYVFVLDSFGKSTLLFPSGGNVENRYPLASEDGRPPTEITLGEHPLFRVSEPFGTDTYILLTSEEPIANPRVVELDGVRTRGPQGRTALENLLSQTGSTLRGDPIQTPVTWSIQSLTFQSLPPSDSEVKP